MSAGKDSHAYLPAVKVVDACFSALKEVALSRSVVEREVVSGYMRSNLWMALLPRIVVRRKLPPELREIVELHREEERKSIDSLMALAKATLEDDEEFRVYVSAADFDLIRKMYGNRRDS